MNQDYQNNLPPGVTDEMIDAHFFGGNDLGEKECDECDGVGTLPEQTFDWEEMDVHVSIEKCWKCEGRKTIPMTDDDVLNEREARAEQRAEL